MRFALDGRVVDRLDVLVDPGVRVPVAIQRLTGLTDADVVGGPAPAEAAAMLAEFAEGAHLVAHGAAFDVAHCAALLPEVFGHRPCLDTLELARILLPAASSHSLPLLAMALGIEHARPHRADSDAEATRALLVHLVDAAESMPRSILAIIRDVLAPLDLPLTTFFTGLVRGDGDAVRPSVAGPPIRRGRRVQGGVEGSVEKGLELAPPPPVAAMPLADAVAAALGPDGPLAGSLPGYEHREAQVEMARAVAQTLERSGRLLVEAGTGTGKSIGYLAPLALWSARTGGRGVVATHTITLQEQLAERDLPALVEQLGIPVSGALLKGRQHYLSLRRWERFLGTLTTLEGRRPDLDTLRFALRILAWLGDTSTGDRAELRLSGPEDDLWRRVESTVDDCLGSACRNWRDGACFMVAARRRAAEADIVVTNHALLIADSERQGQVLAAFDAVVVDEAQHLEETATRQLGTRLRAGDVTGVLDRVHEPGRPPGAGSALGEELTAARDATQRLFGDVKGHVGAVSGQDTPTNSVVGLGPEHRGRPDFGVLMRAGQATALRLRRAAAALLDARGAQPAQQGLPGLSTRNDDELELAAAALSGHAEAVERVLVHPRDGHVAWLELRAEQAELDEAPVSVADALAEHVFERARAAVLTSATLSVAGSFDFIRERTGLRRAETLHLASPFDFLSQALTVVTSDMPPYDAAEYDEALARLVVDLALRLEGRLLVLFTGYAPLRGVHRLLGSRLEEVRVALLGQGIDGTRRQVLASFLANPRSVLLGTSSFWEGVDVPGDALRCVVIAKLPFPVPTDPLTAARAQLLRDPFRELALPIAVLRLKQGFGRLIRTGSDRGAVVLCDTRLLSRDYGATFLQALPETTVVRVACSGTARVVGDFVATGRIPAGARRAVEYGDAAGGGIAPDADPDIYPHFDDEGGA